MLLAPHIAEHRDQYVAFFRQVLALNWQAGASLTPELLVVHGDADPPFNSGRIDVALTAPPDDRVTFQAVDLERCWNPPRGLTQHTSGVTLQLAPFQWSRCQFHFSADPARTHLEVSRWATSRIDLDDRAPPDSDGIQGVVHYVHLHAEGAAHTLAVDFGTAPAEALDELLSVLASAEVRAVRISEGLDETPR